MLEMYEENLKKIESDIADAYEAARLGGVSTSNEAQIKIKQLEGLHVELAEKINKIKQSSHPDENKVHCFVLCTNKKLIKDSIETILFNQIDANRYHETDATLWRPFMNEAIVQDILNEFMELKGYNFQINFIDSNSPTEDIVLIDNSKSSSFALIDLLSINESNAPLTQRLDTKDFKGIIMPCCRYLNEGLKRIMDERRSTFFRAVEYYSQYKPEGFYAYEISAKHSFFQQLLVLFHSNFPITNSIKKKSSVRSIDFTLR